MNFIKKIIGLRKKEEPGIPNIVVATLNDKMMPIERGEIYEDPLDEFLQQKKMGEVTGGGTMQLKTGELEHCDVEIQLFSKKTDLVEIKAIIEKLEQLGAPKGSRLTIEQTGQEIAFGNKEGMGIYLDGINLDPEVYQNCDVNFVISEIKRLINDDSGFTRYWEGENTTALYFYSNSFNKMKTSIKEFVSSYPLCKGARMERIA